MTRFNRFTDEELDAMESAFCNEGLIYLVDEIRRERRCFDNRIYQIIDKYKAESEGTDAES